MKVFQNKKIIKRIAFLLLIITIVGFCYSGRVEAKDDAVGGKLLNPICDLFVFLGDSFMNIIHGVIYKHYDSTIEVDLISGILAKALTIAVGIVTAVVVAIAVIFSGGLIVAAAAAIGVTLSTIGVGTVLLISLGAGVVAASVYNSNVLPDTIHLPVYQISPEQIFSNEVLLFDVDFFNPKAETVAKDSEGNTIRDDDGKPVMLESTAETLRGVISNWYVILRDIALVALLSILVYIGIRIIVSSTSNDKAKYKQMLVDWIVAICLLFIMQYVMSFSNILVAKITELVKSSGGENSYIGLIEDEEGKISNKLNDLGYDVSDIKITVDDKDYINWTTNLLGISRLNAQMAKKENTTYAGYAFIFFILVLFTIYFIFTYLKRVLYMAFLTIIAPLVAMTYPIDKINDGKAQAFEMWIKEYIFNLLIQPMHLLLYTALVTSAFELASENIIYSLVALGFMVPAEKLLRRFFGFEKAHTPGLLAGPAGAAATMSMMHKLLGMGPKPGSRPGEGGKTNSTSKDNNDGKAPYTNPNFDKIDAMVGDGSDNSNNNPDVDILDDNSNASDDYDSYEDFREELNDPENHTAPQEQLEDPSLEDPNTHPEEYDEDGNYIGPQQENNDQEEIQTQDIEQEESSDETSENNNEVNDVDIPEPEEQPRRVISKPSFRQQLGRNIRSYAPASRYYAKGLAQKAGNRIKNSHPLRTAIRTAGGVAAGATAAGFGLALGVVSGDPNKAVQYTATAGLGGYKFGSNTVSSVNQALQVDGIDEMQEKLKYESDQEYKEAKQQEYIKDYQKNLNNQMKLERKYGKKRGKEIMKNVVPECLNNGITDIDDIITIHEMVNNNIVDNLDMGIATAKNAAMTGDTTKMKKKDKNDWKDTFRSKFEKNKNVQNNNMDPDKLVENTFRRIDSFYSIKGKI